MLALSFAEQCCDADYYLYLGKMCAKYGECYENLRPSGSLYWFSIPHRLHLHPSSLIYFHILLTIISIVLSIKACRLLIEQNPPRALSRWGLFVIVPASIVAHWLFLYPVFRHSLSDAPAALFALISVWLLIISPSLSRLRFYTFVLAGIFLGLATWIRAFYLYPVLLMTSAWLLIWLYKKPTDIKWLGFFIVLLPLIFQAWKTYQHTGSVSYIENNLTQEWQATHLNSTAIGYDTLLPAPGSSYRWESDCHAPQGLLDAVKNRDLFSLACTLGGRLNFYLGSYSPSTYTLPSDSGHPVPEEIRTWSLSLLIGNLLAFLITLLFPLIRKNYFTAEQWIAVLFTGLCCIQALLIIPEQRFVIMPMIIVWLLCITHLISIKNGRQTPPSAVF